MSSNMSAITNGGKGSNSQDFKLDDVRRRRRSDSKMGRNSLNTESVGVKKGGGEPAVESRRPSSLVVSIDRKSSAEKDGVTDGGGGDTHTERNKRANTRETGVCCC